MPNLVVSKWHFCTRQRSVESIMTLLTNVETILQIKINISSNQFNTGTGKVNIITSESTLFHQIVRI